MVTSDDRGQAYTMEALIGALLLIASVIFAMEVAAVTPLSASTSNQQIHNQHEGIASGALDAAAARDSLRSTALFWNETNGTFHKTGTEGYYVSGGPPTALGQLLDRKLRDQGMAYNLNIKYLSRTGDIRTEKVVHFGQPSDQAVRVVEKTTLYDDDVMYAANGTPTNTTLAESETFYAPDASPDSPVYNVIQVEVVLWRV